MPADYLSRNLVAAISWDATDLQNAQNADPLIKALKNFLLNKELPLDTKCQQLIKLFANDCFIEDDIGVALNVNLNQAESSFFSLLPLSNKPLWMPMAMNLLGTTASTKPKSTFFSVTTGRVWMLT
jgi:hypothetical protein